MPEETTIADNVITGSTEGIQFANPPNWMPAEKSAAPVDDPCIAGHMKKMTAEGMSDADARKKAEKMCAEGETPMKELSKQAEDTIVRRVVDAIKNLGRKDDDATGFKVQGNHFFTVWSNNFKDRDGEIFTAPAIDAYVKRVDMGVVPKPELWVWHGGKETAIGTTHWVGRDGHFLMAMGEFYGSPQAQNAKQYFTKHAKDTGISHGYTYPSKAFDGRHYRDFNTFEISLLPRGKEANWYTSLEGVKAMALDEDKVKLFKDAFGEEHATRILADWDARGKALEDLNVEFKDFVAADAFPVSEKGIEIDIEATKAHAQILSDLMENSSVPVTAALEAVKLVKAQNAEIATLRAEIAAVKALVEQRPRASQSAETVIETSHLSADMQKQLKEQNTVKDGFWGTEVTR